MPDLNAKVALVTGGARGLGEAICRNLAEAGAIVVVADIRVELAETVAGEIMANGGKAIALALDISDENQVQTAIAQLLNEYTAIDILINNAGIDVTLPVTELEIADWDRIMAVNLRAPFLLSKLVLPTMLKRGDGHIINIASTAAKRCWPNASAYHASKWGLLGFSHALHSEVRSQNIKVTAIIAGGMRTPFLLDRFPDLDVNKLQDPANVAAMVRYVLLQPEATVIPEVTVLPLQETSWP
uniref:Short-chain dehydrogenase/reductase SDR n=1 Tax=Cyanothece sp. (strain PCC 7425 / ATCC 29141) TaxID=395961 RepID=B8HSR4_CYAP4